ncbi:hypothetical protein [Escherichia coli]|uniref:hypothetical protein n=1 Tax=Escherichia coli TaxID=562 RepID=UPI0013520F96|nr:hypothetical protein [Escherichia coli]
MATGINEKSKQNPRFLYSSDRSKNVLRVRSRPVGLQPPISRKTGDFCVHSSVALRPLHDFSPTPVTPLNTIPNTNFGDVPIAKSHNKNLIATISRLCGIKLIGTLPLHLTMICSFNEYRTRHQLFQTRPLVAAFLIKAA